MDNFQSAYKAYISNTNQKQTIEMTRRTLSIQSSILSDNLVGLGSATLFDELQALLDIWQYEAKGYNDLVVSVLVTALKIRASVSTNDEDVISASELIQEISIDWEHFDKSQYLRNDDRLELPIKFELKSERTICNLSFLNFTTCNAFLTGSRTDVERIISFLQEKGINLEELDAAGIKLIKNCIDPQKIKLDPKYCLLSIDGVEIPFRENSQQMKLLRAMFRQRGGNHTRLDFDTYYEMNNDDDWLSLCQKNDGKDKNKFIKDLRNVANAINNKIREHTGWTEDFLEVKNCVCRINPKLIHKV